MTPYYVMMTTEQLKLLELYSTSSCVNLVTIPSTVLKTHWLGGASEATLQYQKVQKSPVWIGLVSRLTF